jgi:hypothetical protein
VGGEGVSHGGSYGKSAFILAHVPIRWNHLTDKNMRQIKGLSMILSQKWIPLLRIMLWYCIKPAEQHHNIEAVKRKRHHKKQPKMTQAAFCATYDYESDQTTSELTWQCWTVSAAFSGARTAMWR